MNEIIKQFKLLGMLGLIFIALVVFGNIINAVVNWSYITIFFTLIRTLLHYLDFIIDNTTLFTLIGYSLVIQAAWWSFEGVMAVINFFK